MRSHSTTTVLIHCNPIHFDQTKSTQTLCDASAWSQRQPQYIQILANIVLLYQLPVRSERRIHQRSVLSKTWIHQRSVSIKDLYRSETCIYDRAVVGTHKRAWQSGITSKGKHQGAPPRIRNTAYEVTLHWFIMHRWLCLQCLCLSQLVA